MAKREKQLTVGLTVAGNQSRSEHLSKQLGIGRESGHGVDDDDEGEDQGGEQESDNKSPPWQLRVTLQTVKGQVSIVSKPCFREL